MTSFQLLVLAIILYSIATTIFIIFQMWQLYRSRKKNDELCFEVRMYQRCLEDNMSHSIDRDRTDRIFLPN